MRSSITDIITLTSGELPVVSDSERTNVVAALDRFVGRKDEMRAVVERFRERRRLVTLLGPPGVGKTRLAAEFAARVVHSGRFEEVWWVDASSFRTGPSVLMAALRVAGGLLPNSSDASGVVVALERALRSRGRVLLVLDNLEQVESGLARILGELVATLPDLFVLGTSQKPVGVRGEARLDVSPLPPETDGAALLLERIRDLDPGLEARIELSDLEAIASRLDGIPLALELAAARINVLSPERLLRRLDASLDALGRGPSYDPRHETLRAAVGWSWGLLPERARTVLACACVFVGGFDASMVETVILGMIEAEPDDAHVDLQARFGSDAELAVLDALDELVARSLVRRRKSRPGLLDTYLAVRAFGREQLDDLGLAAAAERAHARWAARLVEERTDALTGAGMLEDYAGFDVYEENLRAATERMLAIVSRAHPDGDAPFPPSPGSVAADAMLIAAGLSRFLQARGRYTEYHGLNERLWAVIAGGRIPLPADEAAVEAAPQAVRYSLMWRGVGDRLIGDLVRASEDLDASERWAPRDDTHCRLYIAWSRGVIDIATRDLDAAEAHLEAARFGARQNRMINLYGRATRSLSQVAMLRGQTERARELATEAFNRLHAHGDNSLRGSLALSLANVAIMGGDLDEAFDYAERTTTFGRQLEDPVTEGYGWTAMAGARLEAGELAEARDAQLRGVVLMERCGHRHHGHMVLLLGTIVLEQSDDASALALYERAHIEVVNADSAFRDIAETFRLRRAWTQRRFDQARDALAWRLQHAERIGNERVAAMLRAEAAAISVHEAAERTPELLEAFDALPAPDAVLAREVVAERLYLAHGDTVRATVGRDAEARRAARERLRTVLELVETSESARPWLRRSLEVRHAHRRLVAALPERVESGEERPRRRRNAASAASGVVDTAALLVSYDSRHFRPPGNDWIDLGRKKRLRDLLQVLVSRRVDGSGQPVTTEELVEALWPGEKILPDAATNRVYYSVSTLRKLGLGDLLAREGDGYVLDPEIPVVRVDP